MPGRKYDLAAIESEQERGALVSLPDSRISTISEWPLSRYRAIILVRLNSLR